MMHLRVWLAISMTAASCSSPAKPEPPGPQTPVTPTSSSPRDAAEVAATPDAPIAIDDKHPRIFPWALWRERNEKWLATPSNDHCDPRNDHVRRKGESECYPPINVQLAAMVISGHRSNHDNATKVLTLDRGYFASVNSDYYISILDADDRPATKWVHPSLIQAESVEFELPRRLGLPIDFGNTHAAIVQQLTSDDRFSDDDPRSQP
jgi:hypothetical protein